MDDCHFFKTYIPVSIDYTTIYSPLHPPHSSKSSSNFSPSSLTNAATFALLRTSPWLCFCWFADPDAKSGFVWVGVYSDFPCQISLNLSSSHSLSWHYFCKSFSRRFTQINNRWPQQRFLMFSPERKAREAPSVCVIFGLWASLLFQPAVKEELTPSTDAYSHPSETFLRLTWNIYHLLDEMCFPTQW